MTVDLIYFCVVALVLSYGFVWGLRRWAGNKRLLDIPNERSSHITPVPRGGGLAIVILSLAGWLLYLSQHAGLSLPVIAGYIIGAVLVAGASWLDDVHSLPVRARFIVHGVAALIALIALGYWQKVTLPLAGSFDLGWLGFLVTLLWIVGLTNAYNFMDGIDGIAGSQAVLAGLGWAAAGAILKQPAISVLGVLLAATSVGFLGHNWPPAHIFMGDVGSAFLGYTFALLPLLSAKYDARLPWIGIMFVWPFVFDAAFTFVRRLIKGEHVFAAHRSHLYQRLVITGRSHCFVTLLYGCLALIGVVLALAWFLEIAGWPALPAVVLLCAGLWAFVVYEEHRQPSGQAASPARSETLQS